MFLKNNSISFVSFLYTCPMPNIGLFAGIHTIECNYPVIGFPKNFFGLTLMVIQTHFSTILTDSDIYDILRHQTDWSVLS